MPPPLSRLLETAIYVNDVQASRRWYREVLGLLPLNPASADDRICRLDLQGTQVLLLFLKGGSTSTLRFPGGTIPPSDSQGTTHFAFAVDSATLPAWRTHLASLHIPIEGEMTWDRGGTSLYFRDPDGHLIELASPGVWPTY